MKSAFSKPNLKIASVFATVFMGVVTAASVFAANPPAAPATPASPAAATAATPAAPAPTAAPAVTGKADLVKGEASYGTVCAACHAPDGNSMIPAPFGL